MIEIILDLLPFGLLVSVIVSCSNINGNKSQHTEKEESAPHQPVDT